MKRNRAKEGQLHIHPSTADNAWYEAYTDAIYSLGKSWPDNLTDEQELWCATVADKYAPRPEREQW